jgi:hypothetical protein
MITEKHKKAIRLWINSKSKDNTKNPSIEILTFITNKVPNNTQNIENTVQLCQEINILEGLNPLTKDEELQIQAYGIQFFTEENGNPEKNLNKGKFFRILNFIGYLLSAVSLGATGLSWWTIGFIVGTWWSYGALKMAIEKQETKPGPQWELPIHGIIYLIAIIGLFITSTISLF